MINSWVVSSVLSVAYILLFLSKAKGGWVSSSSYETTGLLFGFCVWSQPQIPDESHGCHGQLSNSHMIAFLVDLVMALVVVVVVTMRLYLRRPPNESTTSTTSTTTTPTHPKANEDNSENAFSRYLLPVAIALIILSHGLLHLFLYQRLDCYVRPSDLSEMTQNIGYFLFCTFTFFLCLLIQSIGFVTTGQQGLSTVILCSVGLTCGLFVWTRNIGLQWLLPGLFAITHPLSCITGLYTKSPIFTPTMGWLFAVTTLVGCAELSCCVPFFRSIGGHVWYDVFLHLTMMSAILPVYTKTTTTSFCKLHNQ